MDRDLTMALRDLVLARPDLTSSEERRAARVLARPSTDSEVSTDAVIVHYNAAQTPRAEAQATLAVVTQVRDTYLAAGFRAPRSDEAAGGDARFDVYLTDLAKTSAYGYCTSDQPGSSEPERSDAWAFCVLDSDFGGFPGPSTPTELRQVTVAHEYFHAVQFAYDAGEDGWFMEGTAAWIEDYMFDDVNDNMQYAPYSPLSKPRNSLDVFERTGYRQYGSWLFFRWLSERFPEEQAGIPTIVRDFWQAASSTTGSSGRRYSLRAIAEVLRKRGVSLPQAYALFSDANRRARQVYAEGTANSYPVAPAATMMLARPGATKERTDRLDHLASATTRFVPQRLASRQTRLRISIDMADKIRGSVAVVSTYRTDGPVKTRLIRLNGSGNGTAQVPFSSRRVSAVDVTLTNASTRFTDCYAFSVKFSCFGKPLDQDLLQRLQVTVVR